ncbi:MAG: HD domain-containing protein [Lachnospiraceae bacterium]
MDDKRITNPQLAFQYCKSIAKDIHEIVLRTVALQVLEENKELFLTVKGSDWQHHNYAGGLIVHTCNVALNAIRLGEFYKESVCMDLIKFCSLMHDVGKLFDYKNQMEFINEHTLSMNQALLGHGFEGANYIANKLQIEYARDDISTSEGYAKNIITQVSHCIGAHMDGFGACAKQQMFEVLIIGCADKVDAYLEQTIVENGENSFVIGTGETFYKSSVDSMKVMFLGESILRRDLH